MDHTLVRYDSRAFESMTHAVVLAKMVENRAYPPEIAQLPFDYDLAIRGLVIDKQKGNLLKVSRHGAIRASYHGTKPIEFANQKKIYSSTYIDLRDSRYSSIDTAFSISTANVFMQLVDLKERAPQLNLPDYATMATDLMNSVDLAHRDGTLKGIVRKDLSRFIIKDESVVRSLERYRKHEKKLFVLTNSDFNYTKLLLDYAINPFLQEHNDWSELFDWVITAAQKPRFFYDSLSFLQVDPKTGAMQNFEGSLKPGVYQGGCAERFTKDLQLDGDDILYVGDHIYGDIVRLKKDCNWRTAMVIEDLEEEIQNYEKAKESQEKIAALMEIKAPLEEEQVRLLSEKIEGKAKAGEEKRLEELQAEIQKLDKEISEWIRRHHLSFNKYWGEVMRAGNEESYFATQVDRYACVYMAKIADLLEYSPRTYFRALRRPLAHELARGISSTM